MQIAYGHLSNKLEKPEGSWRLGTFSSLWPCHANFIYNKSHPRITGSPMLGLWKLACWRLNHWLNYNSSIWNSNEACESHDVGTSNMENPSFAWPWLVQNLYMKSLCFEESPHPRKRKRDMLQVKKVEEKVVVSSSRAARSTKACSQAGSTVAATAHVRSNHQTSRRKAEGGGEASLIDLIGQVGNYDTFSLTHKLVTLQTIVERSHCCINQTWYCKGLR